MAAADGVVVAKRACGRTVRRVCILSPHALGSEDALLEAKVVAEAEA